MYIVVYHLGPCLVILETFFVILEPLRGLILAILKSFWLPKWVPNRHGESYGSPGRPPEHPGMPFGLIWGSFWVPFLGHFRPKSDTRTNTKQMKILDDRI